MASTEPGGGLPVLRPAAAMTDAWYDAFCAAAHMLNTGRDKAKVWWAIGLSPEFAGSWARHGIAPADAWLWMDYGCTAEMAAHYITQGMEPRDLSRFI